MPGLLRKAGLRRLLLAFALGLGGLMLVAGLAMLLGEPGITGLFDTNGRWDLLAEIRSSSLQELADVLERVRLIKGIASTETSIHLQSYKLG